MGGGESNGIFKVHIIGVLGRPLLARRASFYLFSFIPRIGTRSTLGLGCVCALALHLVRVHIVVPLFFCCACVCVCGISKWTLDLAADPRLRVGMFLLFGRKQVVVAGSDLLFHLFFSSTSPVCNLITIFLYTNILEASGIHARQLGSCTFNMTRLVMIFHICRADLAVAEARGKLQVATS